MAKYEIFQSGVSCAAETLGEPRFQIGTPDDSGGWTDILGGSTMTKAEAEVRLATLGGTKTKAPAKEKAPAKKKAAAKIKTPGGKRMIGKKAGRK